MPPPASNPRPQVGFQLLEHSCSCAWPATASMLLEDLMTLGYSYPQVKEVRGAVHQHSVCIR